MVRQTNGEDEMIIAISLVKNEDIWIGRALWAVREFADKTILIDNGSTDRTLQEAEPYADEIIIEPDLSKTHGVVLPYIDTDTWILGVDGDEIYDPDGLRELKHILPEARDIFQLAGLFLHATKVNITEGTATGYMGPPSHVPAKLYNFRNVEEWPADGRSIFHPKTRVTKSDITIRDETMQEYPWNGCPLKCLHTRFLPRSSAEVDELSGKRYNPQDILGYGNRNDRGETGNERALYRKGDLVTVSVRGMV